MVMTKLASVMFRPARMGDHAPGAPASAQGHGAAWAETCPMSLDALRERDLLGPDDAPTSDYAQTVRLPLGA